MRTPHPDLQIHRAHLEENVVPRLDGGRHFFVGVGAPITHNTHSTPTLHSTCDHGRANFVGQQNFCDPQAIYRQRLILMLAATVACSVPDTGTVETQKSARLRALSLVQEIAVRR
jgi:hypothetical protein